MNDNDNWPGIWIEIQREAMRQTVPIGDGAEENARYLWKRWTEFGSEKKEPGGFTRASAAAWKSDIFIAAQTVFRRYRKGRDIKARVKLAKDTWNRYKAVAETHAEALEAMRRTDLTEYLPDGWESAGLQDSGYVAAPMVGCNWTLDRPNYCGESQGEKAAPDNFLSRMIRRFK